MLEFDFEAIGTHWWITLFDDIKHLNKSDIIGKTTKLTTEFENNYSRFKTNSYTTQLNTQKRLVVFPKEFYDMLVYAEKIRSITAGHFGVSVGSDLERLGYDKNYTFSNKGSRVQDNNNSNSILKLNEEEIVIAQDSHIDLGGIGKGWLIDKITSMFVTMGFKYFSINGGGDIFATSNYEIPVEFILENPFNHNESIGTIMVKNKAVACSSPNRRSWIDIENNIKLHHLIDLATGEPKSDLASVFTQGDSALAADTASTAIFVSPLELVEKISEYLKVQYMVIFTEGSYIKSLGYTGSLNI